MRQARPRSIAATRGKTPRFQVYTLTAGLLFGFVGAGIDGMAKRFSLLVVDAGELDEGRAPHLMMRIRTQSWGVRNAVNGGAAVAYEGTLLLTDTRTNEVLAQATCVSHPVEGQPIGALAANGSALLRDELREVTEYCLEDYRHRILGLYLTAGQNSARRPMDGSTSRKLLCSTPGPACSRA